MLKVGIMSMQRIQNYGSFLQAYALKKIIENFGCAVEFVDYHVGECIIKSSEGTGIKRKLNKAADIFKQKNSLKEKLEFISYKKNYSKNYFQYLGINDTYNYTPELDVLVIGSDEVFNCVQNNTNVGYSPELFGANNKAKKLISYAASFGNTTLEKIEKYGIGDDLSKYLNSFNSISVRDKNSANIIKALTGKEPEQHLDPVLIYDYMNLCKEIPESVPEDNYMLLYGYSGRFSENECREIGSYARKHSLKILCIGGIQNCCDKFINCSPFEVIAYFRNAECIVTDTFHGTILSIITHSNFAVFVRENIYGNCEKLKDLMEKFNLKEHVVSSLTHLEDILSKECNYIKTDNIIKADAEKTKAYLRRELV